MCTDLRLLKLSDHVSARSLDFAFELGSNVQVVPAGRSWQATTPAKGTALTWTNDLGFVAMDGFGFDHYYADGLNEAGLSVGTLWLPETRLPAEPAPDSPAIDFVNLAGWLLGTCRTVTDVRAALSGVNLWNAPMRDLWPSDRGPFPQQYAQMKDWAPTEHLAIHDAHGGDLVVEFLDGEVHLHDNPVGVLTNSPTFDWHLTNLRNYVGLTNIEDKPVNLAGLTVTPTGNGTGLLGMPGDVTPPSRFVRATVIAQVSIEAKDKRDAVNQALRSLELCCVPRHLAASGDYTQWTVARDHDTPAYYVRAYDSWQTDAYDLTQVLKAGPATHPLPGA